MSIYYIYEKIIISKVTEKYIWEPFQVKAFDKVNYPRVGNSLNNWQLNYKIFKGFQSLLKNDWNLTYRNKAIVGGFN